MTKTEAYELLLAHATLHPDENHPLHRNGFLAMLRPYDGLIENNFKEVLQALQVVAPELQNAPSIDRNLMSALWGICHFAHMWGLDPGGMVRRNNLISSTDVERLSLWVETISYAVAALLEGQSLQEAFQEFYSPEPTDSSSEEIT